MNIARVDFMQSISIPGKGMMTGAGANKDGVGDIIYNEATGLVTVTSRGEKVLIPLTSVKAIYPVKVEPKPEPAKK